MSRELADSRRSAVQVNLAKFWVMAALTPPVVVGIAQSAARLDNVNDVAALVTLTASTGAVAAIFGALALGALSDAATLSVFGRWTWVFVGVLLGAVGLVVVGFARAPAVLVLGWAVAEFGYAGAIAVLRAILGASRPAHRRRGSVVAVIGGYAGILLPLGLLLLLPAHTGVVTFGLAVATLMVPLFVIWGSRQRSKTEPRLPLREITLESSSAPAVALGGRRLSRWGVLPMQFGLNIVLAGLLSFHSLDLAARFSMGNEVPVQASALVLVAALFGVLSVSAILLKYPNALRREGVLLVVGGALLSVSLAGRALSDSFGGVVFFGVLSGVGVGLCSATLLVVAIELAPKGREGRFLGFYSAATGLGQALGPIFGYAVLAVLNEAFISTTTRYSGVFLGLAIVPFLWVLVVFFCLRPRKNIQRVEAEATSHS